MKGVFIMKNCKCIKEVICFAGGLLFGTAGIKILTGKKAKKAYVGTIAAGLRAKDCVLDTISKVQENAEDILAEAKAVNEEADAAEAAEDCVEAEQA